MPIRLTKPATPKDDGPKHVIAEYKHRAQTITCECGWHGSTTAKPGGSSEWQLHLAANRPKRT